MQQFQVSGLNPEMIQAITDLGFEKLTPIQEKILPAVFEKQNDLIGLAQTGTGKTAAFGLPLIQQTTPKSLGIQHLILCPTRELCVQITKDLQSFSKYSSGIQVVAVYGGANIMNQIKEIKQGCQFVVGTPGRVLDLLRRKVLKLHEIKTLVLDEADEMLNMGFKEDLDAIFLETPSQKRTLLFSATMPKEISVIAGRFMKDALEISVGTKNSGAELVKHDFYLVQARHRYEALKRIADMYPKIYGIVFCRTRQETREVSEKLIADGYNADALHGDLSQAQRDQIMHRFRRKTLNLLVATDVAARGLDIHNLSHVINYNLPDELENYIHRSGRTGRAGKHGISISIIQSRDLRKIKDLERLIGKKFERKLVPGGSEICEKKLFNLIDKMEKAEVIENQLNKYLPAIYEKLAWMSREDIIKQFISLEFNEILDYYHEAADLNIDVYPGNNTIREKRYEKASMLTFKINLGAHDRINPTNIIGLINERTRLRNIKIGKIEIAKDFSTFELEDSYEKLVCKSFRNFIYRGKKIKLQSFEKQTNTRRETLATNPERRNSKFRKKQGDKQLFY